MRLGWLVLNVLTILTRLIVNLWWEKSSVQSTLP